MGELPDDFGYFWKFKVHSILLPRNPTDYNLREIVHPYPIYPHTNMAQRSVKKRIPNLGFK